MNPESKLINPYSLLGVKHTCSISELKKQYYNLSLLTHLTRVEIKKISMWFTYPIII